MLKNHLKNIKRFYREVTFDIVKFDFVAEVEITELVRGINAYVQGCSKTLNNVKVVRPWFTSLFLGSRT